MSRLLVIDANADDRRTVSAALRFFGYEVEAVKTPRGATPVLRRRAVHAIVCDPSPDDPIRSVRYLRAQIGVPIVVTAYTDGLNDEIAALDAGADDYIAKPLNLEELRARVTAVLRRGAAPNGAEPPMATEDFTVALADRRWIRADGSEAHLTPVEWRIVDLLLDRAGHLVTHEELQNAVWGLNGHRAGTLRVHLASIRRKVEPDPSHPRYFITAPGLGFRFEPDAAATAQSC